MIADTKYNFLVQQYKNRVYNYSLYLLQNRMDADDVTQEVLIKVWKHIGDFNILAAKTWIMRTTHNLCIDYLRKRKSENTKNPLSIDDVSAGRTPFTIEAGEMTPSLKLKRNVIEARDTDLIEDMYKEHLN